MSYSHDAETDRIIAIARNGERGLPNATLIPQERRRARIRGPEASAETPKRVLTHEHRRRQARQEVPRRTDVAKQVRLRLVYIDFWSAVKLSFLAALSPRDRRRSSAFFLVYTVRADQTGLIARSTTSSRDISDRRSSTSVDSRARPGDGASRLIVAILEPHRDHRRSARSSPALQPRVKVTGGLLVGFTSN